MRTIKLQKLTVLFVFLLSATTLFAQGYGRGNGRGNAVNNNGNRNLLCIEQITDLTDKQKTEITALEEEHQKEMTELRNKRRSTVNTADKDKIREEMVAKVDAHRAAVKKLLTADQQKQYDDLQANRKYYQRNSKRGQWQQYSMNNRGRGRGGKGCGNRGHRNGRYGNGRGYNSNVN